MTVETLCTLTTYKLTYEDKKGREIEATVEEEDNSDYNIYDFRVIGVQIDGVQDYDKEIDEDEIIDKLKEEI